MLRQYKVILIAVNGHWNEVHMICLQGLLPGLIVRVNTSWNRTQVTSTLQATNI